MSYYLKLLKVDTAGQLADIFTKPLPYPQFAICIQGILRLKKRPFMKADPGG